MLTKDNAKEISYVTTPLAFNSIPKKAQSNGYEYSLKEKYISTYRKGRWPEVLKIITLASRDTLMTKVKE